MAVIDLVAPDTREAVLSWHVGAADIRRAAPFAAGRLSIVLSGGGGARTGRQLRRDGYTGQLLVDPAVYASSEEEGDGPPQLFEAEIDWADLQRRAGASSLLTPGVYVPHGDIGVLEAAVEGQLAWAEANGGASLQLALHWRWLTDDVDWVVDLFSVAGAPITILLCDGNDPLSRAGAVDGLVQLASGVPDVGLHRSDLGSLGFIAHGGAHAATGISTTLRHVVPPNTPAGGRRGDRSPSVFVPQLLAWLKGSKLSGLGAGDTEGRFGCAESCCDGKPLSRFWDEATRVEAEKHNRITFEAVAAAFLDVEAEERESTFKAMCGEAEILAADWSGALKRDLSHPQRAAWSNR